MSRPCLVCKRGVLLTVKKQKYFVTTANVSLNIILNVRLPQSRKPCSNDCPVICDERFKNTKGWGWQCCLIWLRVATSDYTIWAFLKYVFIGYLVIQTYFLPELKCDKLRSKHLQNLPTTGTRNLKKKNHDRRRVMKNIVNWCLIVNRHNLPGFFFICWLVLFSVCVMKVPKKLLTRYEIKFSWALHNKIHIDPRSVFRYVLRVGSV